MTFSIGGMGKGACGFRCCVILVVGGLWQGPDVSGVLGSEGWGGIEGIERVWGWGGDVEGGWWRMGGGGAGGGQGGMSGLRRSGKGRGLGDKDCQGKLLAIFHDDAKYEHVGQDTRSQDGEDDKDKQGKDLNFILIVEENGQIRNKKYAKLTEQEQLQDDCDVQATNIVLQGLPPDVYALVDHCQTAKDIWDRVKLLMQGTELSYQERKCKLYNEFDMFTSIKGDDPIACLNKAMAFISHPVMAFYVIPYYPTTNSEHLLIQETKLPFKMAGLLFNKFKGDRVRVLLVQGIREMLQALGEIMLQVKQGVVKCYNCQGEGHMARQCTQPKLPRNSAWLKKRCCWFKDRNLVRYWVRSS
ncbi:retrovirus-related pol polyprotein from transposon TNT 1-94 [Tanacetum coccineum]